MKKNLLALCALAISVNLAAFAASYNPEAKVSEIGSALLTKNGITTEIKFETTAKDVDNSSFATNRVVSISKKDLEYAKNDNETASVIANELGHIITGHASKGKLISSVTGASNVSSNSNAANLVENYANTKQEKEADVVAVNLMANAGFNPLAAIVVLTRQTQTTWDAILAKPANADRAMNIYDYTGYAYPKKLSAGYGCQEYKNFLTYANEVVSQRKNNKKAQNKLNKELAKYRKNSVSQISKFKTRGGISGWDAAYGLLNGTK